MLPHVISQDHGRRLPSVLLSVIGQDSYATLCPAPNSISAFVAPKTENQVPGGGLCRIRRIGTVRSTRQDAQMNYLSILSIFMKQTTYLATLPKVEGAFVAPPSPLEFCNHHVQHSPALYSLSFVCGTAEMTILQAVHT